MIKVGYENLSKRALKIIRKAHRKSRKDPLAKKVFKDIDIVLKKKQGK